LYSGHDLAAFTKSAEEPPVIASRQPAPAFSPLTEGLAGLPGHVLSSVEQFLHTYIGSAEAPVPFGGRETQLTELDQWLADPAHPYALMVAEAGRGKSALLTHWVAQVVEAGRAAVVLAPISIRFGTARKSMSTSLLGARLRLLHGVTADPPRDPEVWLGEIDHYLRTDRRGDVPLLIVLDGVDEAIDWVCGRDLRFPTYPGQGVKVLVSARPLLDSDAAGWRERLEWGNDVAQIVLPPLDRSGVASVLMVMGNPLRELGTHINVVGELHRLSAGEPLLVCLYVEELQRTRSGTIFLRGADSLPLQPGLAAYFDRWWTEQREQWGAATPLREPAVRTLLGLFACAVGPLAASDILALTRPEGFDTWILEEALQPLGRFVVGAGSEHGYVFSHPRLHQYFYDKLTGSERRGWEDRFVAYGHATLVALQAGDLTPRLASRYVVQDYSTHLERVGAQPERFYALVSENWLRAWEALEGEHSGFLDDLSKAWDHVDAAGMQATSHAVLAQVIGRQCRYALIQASINSLSSNIPPTLLVALVAKSIWTADQAMSTVRHIPRVMTRVEALIRLSPHLSESLLREALELLRALARSNKSFAAAYAQDGLKVVLPRLAMLGYGDEAVAISLQYEDGWFGVTLLKELARHLTGSTLQKVLAAVLAFKREELRARALTHLVPYLAETR